MRVVQGVGWAVVAAGLAGLTGLGCEQEPAPYGGGPPQCTGNGCEMMVGGNNPSGGGGNGGSLGAGGGAQANVFGTVQEYTDASFTAVGSMLWSSPAQVTALSSMATSMYASGSNPSPQFDLMNVPTGPSWFLVASQGSSIVYPTLSYGMLPAASLPLPIIQQDMFNQVAQTLGVAVSPTAAQVVMVLSNGTVPYQGLTVTTGSGNGTIAYDTGTSGVYSTSATSTGPLGTILIFNAQLNGVSMITLTDTATMTPKPVSLVTNSGAVSLLAGAL